jgi:hypothetical protein
MTKLKFIQQIEILAFRFQIIWDKESDAGSFNWSESIISIGIKSYDKDPLYTLSILSHELMEIVLVTMGARFRNGRTEDNYLFNYDHQTFENAIQVHTQALDKFIDYGKEPKKATGLLDLNGREFYENNIVKCGYGIGQVVFQAGCFMVKWLSDPEASLEFLFSRDGTYARTGEEQFEIIGYIYK